MHIRLTRPAQLIRKLSDGWDVGMHERVSRQGMRHEGHAAKTHDYRGSILVDAEVVGVKNTLGEDEFLFLQNDGLCIAGNPRNSLVPD